VNTLKHNFPFVEIPNYMKNRIGKKDPCTRLFRRQGTEEEVSEWFESICEICEGLGVLSPGGVSMYVRVSRPAVHKRLKEGRLTGFFFHQVSDGKLFKDRKKMQDGGLPYCFIPVSECKAWAEELRIRREKHKVVQVEGSK
jgi:molybdopterin/thiamine biosynthesis adenylyltransferase